MSVTRLMADASHLIETIAKHQPAGIHVADLDLSEVFSKWVAISTTLMPDSLQSSNSRKRHAAATALVKATTISSTACSRAAGQSQPLADDLVARHFKLGFGG